LRPFVVSCQFPYLYQVWWWRSAAFPSWFPVPSDYMVDEPVIGWLRAIPSTWLIPCAFLLVPRPLRLGFRQSRAFLWCLISFSALASTSGLAALGVYGATMRYLTDVSFGLVLLGILGGFALRTHRWGRAMPRLTSTVLSLLGIATVVMGMLIGYQGYNGQFHSHNPKLDAKLVKALSLCGSTPPDVPRYTP
ncbi:MAG TPA: hypothetical protein VIM73_14615, partial [Polyangiaceae bacterium]